MWVEGVRPKRRRSIKGETWRRLRATLLEEAGLTMEEIGTMTTEAVVINGTTFTEEQHTAVVNLVARKPGESRKTWAERVAQALDVETVVIEPKAKKWAGGTEPKE